MNSKYMFIVASMAVMLVGATAFSTDSAFADGKKKYVKNQATSQANACGNDNYHCMSSAKTPVHKVREKRTQ
jgi:hypothetical protein